VVTSEAIEKFAKSYKDSVEERDDILEAYRKFKGKWSGIYNTVMLSDPLEDEDRFRAIIDQAINSEEVQPYKAYTDETAKSKAARMNAARREGAEAVAYAKELGVGEKLFDTGNGGGKESGEEALAALIKKNQAGRSSFFDHLEAKYAGGDSKKSKGKEGRKGKKGKKRTSDEDEDGDDGMPSEEAFQEAAARLQNNKVAAQAGPSDGRTAKRSKR
jgi:DnaJ family protein C protein 9